MSTMKEPSSMLNPSRARARGRSVLSVGLVALALVGGLAVMPRSTSADSAPSPAAPAPTASAAASAGPLASAAASASGAASAAPAIPRFDAEPFPAEKSARPTPAEWKPTTPVALTEELPFKCNAYRVRDWVKIRCSSLASASIALLSGSRDGVFLFVDPGRDGSTISPGGEAMFQVQRGDRRIIEWSTFGESYEGPGFPEVAFLISESWAPDEPAPRIIAHVPATIF